MAAPVRKVVCAKYLLFNVQKLGFNRQVIAARTLTRCLNCPRSDGVSYTNSIVFKPTTLPGSGRLHRFCSSRQYGTDDGTERERLIAEYIEHDNRVLNAIYIGCFGFVLFLGWIAYEYRYKDKKSGTIEKLIVEGLMAERNGRPADAEHIYHKALFKAQEEKNKDGIVYVYDQMANLAMRRGHFQKAEELFKESLRGLLESGFPKDDDAVVEVSLKLAQVYTNRQRHVEATAGYKWCIETVEKKIAGMAPQNVDKNTESLLGLCWNTYAHYLLTQNRLAESEDAFVKALGLCENQLTVDGMKHPQTVTLLNDLGTVCDQQGKFDEAYQYLEKATELAKQVSKGDMPRLLCNMGSIQMHRKNFKEADDCLDTAMTLARKYQDTETVYHIREIQQLLQNALAKRIQ